MLFCEDLSNPFDRLGTVFDLEEIPMTLFVFESTDMAHQRKLFTVLGADYVMTARTWINPFLMGLVGIMIALIAAPVAGVAAQIVVGVVYGALIMLSSFCHGLGHVLSSQWVNAPVDRLIATATVTVAFYADNTAQPSRVHVGRSLGGPLLNLLIGVIALAMNALVLNTHFLVLFGVVNLVFAGFTLTPIPSVDGAVILRELRNWQR
jgi:hypothetical protein